MRITDTQRIYETVNLLNGHGIFKCSGSSLITAFQSIMSQRYEVLELQQGVIVECQRVATSISAMVAIPK